MSYFELITKTDKYEHARSHDLDNWPIFDYRCHKSSHQHAPEKMRLFIFPSLKKFDQISSLDF